MPEAIPVLEVDRSHFTSARFLCALQSVVLGSEQRSSRKHQKTIQSHLPNILQHIIKGTRQRAPFLSIFDVIHNKGVGIRVHALPCKFF